MAARRRAPAASRKSAAAAKRRAAAHRPRAEALSIRPGTARDVPTILALIRGLADYEKLARECRASAANIRRHGFGPRRYFETLICRRGGRPVGFALYFFTYSTFLSRPTLYLEDLFVLPAERGRGAGLALLRALARLAVRRGCGRMEWTVLDWNTPARRFYRALGAGFRTEWVLTRLTGAPLARLAGRATGRPAPRTPGGRAPRSSRRRTPRAAGSRRRPRRRAPARASRSRAASRSRRRA